MARYSIPKDSIRVFEFIIELQENTFINLVNELSKGPIGILPGPLGEEVASKLKLDKKSIVELCHNLFIISRLKFSYEGPTDQFLIEFCDSIEESSLDKIKIDEERWKTLKERLGKLLDLKNILVTSKAQGIFSDFKRLFKSARIITDIRPIFGLDDDEEIREYTIVHNLKISFLEDGANKEDYFALDSDDLKKLMDKINRAEKKEKIIKKSYEASKIPIIEFINKKRE